MLKSRLILKISLLSGLLLTAPLKEPHTFETRNDWPGLQTLTTAGAHTSTIQKTPNPSLKVMVPEKREGLIPVTQRRPAASSRVNRDCNGDCWTLQYVGEDTQWYLGSGAAGDTFAIAFQPQMPCVVQEVYMKWYDGGAVTAFAALLSDSALAWTAGTGAAVNNGLGFQWARGDLPFSPIGELLTQPTDNIIEGYTADWTAQLDLGGTFQAGDPDNLGNVPPFLICFVKQGESPHPMASDVFNGESYNWFGGPWTDPDGDISTPDGEFGDGYAWGNYQSAWSISSGLIDIACQVRVTYPWDWDWVAFYLPTISDTYLTDGSKPIQLNIYRPVNAYPDINDLDLVFHWGIDGVAQETQTMQDATPVDVDEDGNGTYEFYIQYNAPPGSTISCWATAETLTGIQLSSNTEYFETLEPLMPCARLLIIAEKTNSYHVGSIEAAADALGYVYEIWDVYDHQGIDNSVINWGWNTIVVYGWGTGTLPVTAAEEDPGYGEFLANGGHLVLIDQDWFYAHGLDQYPFPLIFDPGDPARDWFGLAGAMSDPDFYGNAGNGGSGDTLIISLNPTIPFYSEPMILQHGISGSYNRADFLYPGDGTPVFQGIDSGEIVGVSNHTADFSTTFLAFQADAAVDTTESGDLTYDQVTELLTWLLQDVTSPPQPNLYGEIPGVIFNDGGQQVLVTVTDTEGDPFTVALYYVSNGEDLQSVMMTNTEADIYSATIPAQPEGTTVEYWAVAEADPPEDCSYAESAHGSYFVYGPSSDVLFVLNNEMNVNGYPGLYYFYDAYDTGNLWLMPDFWTGAVNQDLLSFYDTVFEVTTTGTWADFTDHYAVIQDWLTLGNKNYFLAGDDMFGMLTGWQDVDFSPGILWYDLGISHVFNDIGSGGSEPSPLTPVEGDLLSDSLAEALAAPGGGNILQYDPDYEIGLTNALDGFQAAGNAVPFLFDTNSELPVAVRRYWPNGNRTVILGFDPLSLNSAPEYVWYGAHPAGPTKMSLDWFDNQLFLMGDVNDDGIVDILDVVMLVFYITDDYIFDDEQMQIGDMNDDALVDVADIVMVVDLILEN